MDSDLMAGEVMHKAGKELGFKVKAARKAREYNIVHGIHSFKVSIADNGVVKSPVMEKAINEKFSKHAKNIGIDVPKVVYEEDINQ
jgi:hypothetical protein